MPATDHSRDIKNLRLRSKYETNTITERLTLEVAADLLEIHDTTGISLDNWPSARGLVEHLTSHKIQENGA